MKHLTDEQLMNYLDNALSDRDSHAVRQHLSECSSCQKEFSTFESLYQKLRDEGEFSLPPQFSLLVLAKIKKESLGSVHSKLWQVFLALFGIIVGINTTLYYYDIRPLLQKLDDTHISMDFIPQVILTLKTALFSFKAKVDSDYSLFLATAVIILLLALIDRLFARSKFKSVLLF